MTVMAFRAGPSAARLRCHLVRRRIPEHVMSDEPLRDQDRSHFGSCLPCQAEAANYRLLAQGLRSLRDELVSAPAGFVLRVMANLGRPVRERNLTAERAAVVASVVVVAAAMAILGRRRLRLAS